MITPDEIKFFNNNGYVHLKDILHLNIPDIDSIISDNDPLTYINDVIAEGVRRLLY